MKLYIYNSILNIILIIGIFFKNIFINIASNLDVSLMIILSGISYLILGIILRPKEVISSNGNNL